MIEKTLYIADDGKEFEDVEECKAYEEECAYGELWKNGDLLVFDAGMNKLKLPLDEFGVDDTTYVLFKSDIGCEYFNNVLDYYGFPQTYETGCYGLDTLYKYDEVSEKWIDFTTIFAEVEMVKEGLDNEL